MDRSLTPRRPRTKITLDDVAAHAEVSAITVSRALRNPSRVSEATREKVQQAASELGYVPDLAAQALASKRTDVIGAILPSLTNNVFSEVLRAMFEAVEGTPYQLQLGNSRYKILEEERLVRTFLSQKPAGLILSGIDQSLATRTLLEQADVPIVQIMELGTDPVDMMVGFSHADAARAGVEHLLAQGYRQIGFLGARLDPRSMRRLQGYRQAMEAAGLLDDDLIVTTSEPSSASVGSTLCAGLLTRRSDVDALFCNNDDVALGALFEAQRRGLIIPDQLGICGFNDLDIMANAHPTLTSVRTPRAQMGRDALTMVIEAIEGRRPEKAQRDLGHMVMTRQSTCRSKCP